MRLLCLHRNLIILHYGYALLLIAHAYVYSHRHAMLHHTHVVRCLLTHAKWLWCFVMETNSYILTSLGQDRRKEGEEGCSIDGATQSDYIHNQDE
jgi:hypothetical protein